MYKYIGPLQYTTLVFGFSFLWVLAGIKKETMQLYFITTIYLYYYNTTNYIIHKYTLICIASCSSLYL